MAILAPITNSWFCVVVELAPELGLLPEPVVCVHWSNGSELVNIPLYSRTVAPTL